MRSFFLNLRQCCLYLRGYRPAFIVGDQYQLASVEYRAPLFWFEKGYQTFPIYFRRLHGALFADAGNAYYGTFDPGQLRYGVGGELRLEGVAKGLSKEASPTTTWSPLPVPTR